LQMQGYANGAGRQTGLSSCREISWTLHDDSACRWDHTGVA